MLEVPPLPVAPPLADDPPWPVVPPVDVTPVPPLPVEPPVAELPPEPLFPPELVAPPLPLPPPDAVSPPVPLSMPLSDCAQENESIEMAASVNSRFVSMGTPGARRAGRPWRGVVELVVPWGA